VVWVVSLLLGCVILIFLLLVLGVFVLPKLTYRNLPGPKLDNWFVGNRALIEPVGRTPHFLLEQSKIYGSVFQVWLLHRRMVIVTDPEDVKFIVRTKNFDMPYPMRATWGSPSHRSMLLLKNEEHRVRRRAVAPHFGVEMMNRLHESLCVEVGNFTKKLEGSIGEILDLDVVFVELTLRVILTVAFGYDASDEEVKKVRNLIATYLEFVGMRVLLFPFHTALTDRTAFQKAEDDLYDFLRKMLARRKERRAIEKRNDLLDVLIDASKGDEQILLADMAMYVVGGHDTVAHTLSFLFLYLAKYEYVQKKILDEVDLILDTDDVLSREAFGLMEYTGWVWKEITRLRPIAALGTSREFSETCILPSSKAKLHKGTSVWIPPLVMHQNSEQFPEPEVFRPERWDPQSEETAVRHPYAFQAFSSGPRNCIGQVFAEREALCVVTAVLKKFRIEPICEFESVELFHLVITKPRVQMPDGSVWGLPVRVYRR